MIIMSKEAFRRLCICCNLALLLTAIISGLSFVAQKVGMDYVGPFTFNTLREFIGFLVLLPTAIIYKKFISPNGKRFPLGELVKGGICAGIALFLALSVNQYCMIYAEAGKAGFITSLYIIFVPILAMFFNHKIGKNLILSIIIALIGLYLLCAKSALQFELWDIFLLLSAFFFAVHIMVLSYFSKKTNALELSCAQFLVAGLLSAPLMFILENPALTPILAGWKPILFIGVIVTGIAYTLQTFGYKAASPVLGTLILSSEAVFAVIGGCLLLGETLSFRELTGCALMIAAILISQNLGKRN